MRILAFAASNSSTSINRQLVEHAADRLRDHLGRDVELDLLDLDDHEMPLYGVDRERRDGVPAEANEFLARIAAADAVLVSFAEHNGTFTVAFKNVLDWASRVQPRIWQDRPLVLLATSPGPGGARSVLGAATSAAPFWGGDLRGALSVPRFHDAFDADRGELADGDLAATLDEVLAELAADLTAAAREARAA